MKNKQDQPKKVYCRKILRNSLKRQLKTNKIQQAWHYLQIREWGKNKNESRV